MVGILFFSTGTGLAILVIMILLERVQERYMRKEKQDEEMAEEQNAKDLLINASESDDFSIASTETDENFSSEYGDQRKKKLPYKQAQTPYSKWFGANSLHGDHTFDERG